MAIRETQLPVLEGLIAALREANDDLGIAGTGLTDAKIGAISAPATVAKVRVLLAAIPWKERDMAARDFVLSAYDIASGPIFPLRTTVTSYTPSNSGGSLAAGTYKLVTTAFDNNGRETAPTSESSVVVGGTTNGSIAVLIPPQSGAVKYRVYYSDINGAAGSESRYLESGATAGISTSNVTVTVLTVTISGAVVAGTPPTAAAAAQAGAGYGLITDVMCETARVAALFSTLFNAVADQHPNPLARSFQAEGFGTYAFNTFT